MTDNQDGKKDLFKGILESLQQDGNAPLEDMDITAFLQDLAEQAKHREQGQENTHKKMAELGTIKLLPQQGAGKIYFGMTREQAESILGQAEMEDGFDESKLCFYEMQTKDGKNELVCSIAYEKNKVYEITLYDSLASEVSVTLNGVDVFKEKAENAVAQLEKIYASLCSFQEDDKDLATEYSFEAQGIILWRESAFHPKLLGKSDFQQMTAEEQEYEKRFWHFNVVTIRAAAM